MTEPLIRAAMAEDAPALERLIDQLGYEAAAADVAERLKAMQRDGRLVLVAVLDGRVVGCLSTSVMQVLHRPVPVGRI